MSQKCHKDNDKPVDMKSMMNLKAILILDDLLEQAAIQRDKKARLVLMEWPVKMPCYG